MTLIDSMSQEELKQQLLMKLEQLGIKDQLKVLKFDFRPNYAVVYTTN